MTPGMPVLPGPRRAVPFVRTQAASLGLTVAESVRDYGGVGVISGPAGSGKTMILRAFAADCPDAILTEAHPGWSAGALVRALCARAGLSVTGSLHALSERCVIALKDNPRVLLVDEAELLPVRALETLRRLHDLSGTGVVLAGTPRLLTLLKGSRRESSQLYSRTGMVLDLATCPSTGKEGDDDFTAVLNAMLSAYGVASPVTDSVRQAYRLQSDGNWRRLMLLVQNSVRATRGRKQSLTSELVNACGQMLLR